MKENVFGYISEKLKKKGQTVMVSALLYDLGFAALGKKPLDISEDFRKFLITLDSMLDDDMIFEIKDAIHNILF